MLVSCKARPSDVGDAIGGGAGIAEDAHRQPPDRARDAVAIKVERRELGARMSCAASISMPSMTARKSSRRRRKRDDRRRAARGREVARLAGKDRLDLVAPGGERRLLRARAGRCRRRCRRPRGRTRRPRTSPSRRSCGKQPHRPIERGAGAPRPCWRMVSRSAASSGAAPTSADAVPLIARCGRRTPIRKRGGEIALGELDARAPADRRGAGGAPGARQARR